MKMILPTDNFKASKKTKERREKNLIQLCVRK